MMTTLLLRNCIDLCIIVIVLFGEEGISLSIQKTIMRTSFVKQITVGHGGDFKGINVCHYCYPLSGFYSYV